MIKEGGEGKKKRVSIFDDVGVTAAEIKIKEEKDFFIIFV